MKKMFLIFWLQVFASTTWAVGDWYEMGNGGMALDCPLRKPALFTTFDLYELQSRYSEDLTLDLQHGTTVDERVQYLLKKIQRLNPTRAALYRGWYQNFFKEAEFLVNTDFESIGDLGFAPRPSDCTLKQVVFQREPGILNKRRYQIHQNLWEKFTPMDQAAMILHELIYREFAQAPNFHEKSERTRRFNALVNSQELLGLTSEDYLKILQELKVVKADYKNLSVLVGIRNRNNQWYDFDFLKTPKQTQAILDGSYTYSYKSVAVSSLCQKEGQTPPLGRITLEPSGALLIEPLGGLWEGVDVCPLLVSHGDYMLYANRLYFDAAQNLVEVSINAEPNSRPFDPVLLRTGGYTFAWRSDVQVAVADFAVTSESRLKTLSALARVCREGRDSKMIYLHHGNQFDGKTRTQIDLQNLAEQAQRLPLCNF